MHKLVSVIIPAYNIAEYLSESIDSVLNQTYQHFEVIIVDDGSTDNTADVVNKYVKSQANVKYIHQENKGPGAARNKGIKEAKGEYIAFLDADDIWFPEKVLLQMELFLKLPSISLVHSDFIYFDRQGTEQQSEFSERIKKHFSGDVFYQLFKKNFFMTPTVVIKQEALKDIGLFDEQLCMSEDYDLWLRISKSHKIGYVNTPLAKICKHNDSMTKENIEKTYLWVNRVIDKTIKSFPEIEKKLRLNLPYRMAKTHFEIGYSLFNQDKLKKAKKEFETSLRHKFMLKPFVYYILSFLGVSSISVLKNFKRKLCEKLTY